MLLQACSTQSPLPQKKQLVAIDYDEPCTSEQWEGKQCLSMKDQYFSNLCDWGNGDLEACYKYALVREERRDDPGLILQVHQKACDGGEQRSCESIKRLMRNQCISYRLHPNNDPDCYPTFEEVVQQSLNAPRGYGVSTQKRPRKNTESCNQHLEWAQKAEGCSALGDYEAKLGNLKDAESIYMAGCNEKTREGCPGLVCLGYIKMNEGKKSVAWQLFKQACRHSEIKDKNPSPYNSGKSYDGKSYEGCEVIKANPNYLAHLIKSMPEKEESCKREWSSSWGPSK